MSVTITRTAWIDDDGTGTTGTVINNAVKTDLYNQIDGALALVAQLTGGNSFTGNQTINGILNVIGRGTHLFQGDGTGANELRVTNGAAGPVNYASITLGNNLNATHTLVSVFSSSYGAAGLNYPDGAALVCTGGGGLSLGTTSSTPLRLYTNGLERARVTPTGELLVNTTTNPSGNAVSIAVDQVAHALGIGIQNTNALNGLYFLAFYNSTGAGIGTVSQASATSVAYNTSSDQRLKTDGGLAEDLTALRAVRVHDFTWTAEGIPDRGIFAQEAHAVFPRAVTPGTDDRTDHGVLARPWGTDYSKFVPDLIVGWQQHEAALAELRAALATLKGSAHAQ